MHATLLLSATLLSQFPATGFPAAAAPPAAAPAGGPVAAQPQSPAAGSTDAASPATPAPIVRLLAARSFVLAEGFESDWRAERPLVRSGWLLVIEADAALARQRQTATPVLYVGDQVAERLNNGGPAAPGADAATVRLVVLVPAPQDAAGAVVQPLREAPAYFGGAMLPEQVDAGRAAAELASARTAGLKAPSRTTLDEATSRGGLPLQAADRIELLKAAASLLRQWSPTEVDQADLLEGRPVTAPSGDPDQGGAQE